MTSRATPALPWEIWRLIFMHATSIPFVLDTSPLSPLSNEKRSFAVLPQPHLGFSAMRTKRTLALVCKYWNSISIEFLYTFVWLRTPKELFSLVDSLQQRRDSRPKSSPTSSRDLGRYIKCIWISAEEWSGVSPELDALNSLLSLSQNLRILRLWSASSFIPIIIDQFASLRFVDMNWAQSTHFLYPLLKQLAQPNNLEILRIRFGRTPGHTDQCLSFPHLHSLILFAPYTPVGQILGHIIPWKLPSLSYLSLEGEHDPDTLPFQTFLSSSGQNLTTLILPGSNGVLAPHIAKYCPKLEDLCIDFASIDRRPFAPLSPTPRLRQVRFSGSAYTYNSFIDFVNSAFINNRPSLQCIRILGAQHDQILSVLVGERSMRWREWNQSLSERNIRLEDQYGLLIGEEMKKVDVDTDRQERTAFFLSSMRAKVGNTPYEQP